MIGHYHSILVRLPRHRADHHVALLAGLLQHVFVRRNTLLDQSLDRLPVFLVLVDLPLFNPASPRIFRSLSETELGSTGVFCGRPSGPIRTLNNSSFFSSPFTLLICCSVQVYWASTCLLNASDCFSSARRGCISCPSACWGAIISQAIANTPFPTNGKAKPVVSYDLRVFTFILIAGRPRQ
jgi:hypothetical protein